MPRFDRNQTSLTEKIVRENTKNSSVGIVSQVFEHSAPDDDSNWEVTVEVEGKTNDLGRVPYHTPGSDLISPPRNGDKVLIHYTEGETFRPVAFGIGWSNTDRPPLGRAGIYRNRFESDTSPAGDGSLHFTGYTKYDGDVASTDKRELNPEEARIQITKHAEQDNMDPSDPKDVPAKIEMYDSPKDDKAHIHLNVDEIDKDESLGMDVFLNMKTGQLHVRGENGGDTYEFVIDVKNKTAKIIGDSFSGNKMGASFNFGTDEFSIADGNKFGITSDGSGNFTWSHKTIDFKEESGTSGSINI